jgi:hypothetical protein
MWKLTLGYGTFLHRWMYVAPNITWHILGKLFPKKRKEKEKETPPLLPILVQIGSTCRYEVRER